MVLPNSAPVLAVTPYGLDASFAADNQRYASVACDPAGDFVITWTDYHTLANGTQQSNVYVRRFDAMGSLLGVDATTGNPVVDPSGHSAATQVNAYTSGPQKWSTVAMDVKGDFVVTWSSFSQDAAGGYGVYAQRFDPTGTAVGSPFQVNQTTAGNQDLSTVAMDGQGNFFISWTSDSANPANGTDVYVRAYNAQGIAAANETLVNVNLTGNQKDSDVATDLGGDNIVVTWESAGQDGSGYGIYARRYTVNNNGGFGGRRR